MGEETEEGRGGETVKPAIQNVPRAKGRRTYKRGDHCRPGFAQGLHHLEHVHHVFRFRAFQEIEQRAEHACLLRPVPAAGDAGFKGDVTGQGKKDSRLQIERELECILHYVLIVLLYPNLSRTKYLR